MLAYLFWHRAAREEDREGYEQAVVALHRSLAASPPGGFLGSACFRAPELPGLAGAAGLEDWYAVEDWTALGVLRQAAVASAHRRPHDAAAGRSGAGAGGVYRLSEGHWRPRDAHVAVWASPPSGHQESGVISLLLGDGLAQAHGGLWRRELVLGPAAEYCLLAPAAPAGARPDRLPDGWRAQAQERVILWPA